MNNQIITISTTFSTAAGYSTIIGAALGNLAAFAYRLADMADRASVSYEAVMPGIIRRVARAAGAVWHVLTILAAKAWALALCLGVFLVATGKAACRLGKMVCRLGGRVARTAPGVARMVAEDIGTMCGEVARLATGTAFALASGVHRCCAAAWILSYRLYRAAMSRAAGAWAFRAEMVAEMVAEEL